MSEGVMIFLFFAAVGIIYLVVSFIGNKIVDKGEDAIRNSGKRRKNSEQADRKERLSDRYR